MIHMVFAVYVLQLQFLFHSQVTTIMMFGFIKTMYYQLLKIK